MLTYFGNEALYRSIEQVCGRTRVPLPVSLGKLMVYDMTGNTCKGNVALPPLLESEFESVVLDPLYASNTILLRVSAFISPCDSQMKYFYTQLSLGRRDDWQLPLRSTASPLRIAPSLRGRAAVAIELAVERW